MVAIPAVVLAPAAFAARRTVVRPAARALIAARRFTGRPAQAFGLPTHGPRPSKLVPGGAKARALPVFEALAAYFLLPVAVHAAGLATARS